MAPATLHAEYMSLWLQQRCAQSMFHTAGRWLRAALAVIPGVLAAFAMLPGLLAWSFGSICCGPEFVLFFHVSPGLSSQLIDKTGENMYNQLVSRSEPA